MFGTHVGTNCLFVDQRNASVKTVGFLFFIEARQQLVGTVWVGSGKILEIEHTFFFFFSFLYRPQIAWERKCLYVCLSEIVRY